MFAATLARLRLLLTGGMPGPRRKGTPSPFRMTPRIAGHSLARLTSGVAHDINNLLQTVSGNLELLGDLVAGNGEAEELLRIIAGSAGHSGQVTHNLMAFCRQQVAGPAWRADLRLVMERMRDLLPRALGSSAQVVFQLPADLAPVTADPGQLELCILEAGLALFDAWPLAGLAVDVTHVTVAEPGDRPAGDYAVIAIANRSQDNTPAQVGEAAAGELAALVRRCGADPRILRTPQGLRVEMWMPLVTARPKAAGSTHAPLVLLVDDAPDVLITLSAFLEGEGFAVVTARNGADALAALGTGRRFDVIVTDYAMPGMSGIELLEHARTIAPGLPSIIVTGFAAVEKLVGVRDQVEVLRKPFRREYLVSRVRALAEGGPQAHAMAGSARTGEPG